MGTETDLNSNGSTFSPQMIYRLFPTLALSLAATFISAAAEADSSIPRLSANLFRQSKIWDIQLTLTPDQWTALQPEEPEGGGPPGGGRGPGGGGRGFNPAMFIAPGFMGALDRDNNNELSRTEFVGGFDRWFTAWNINKSGQMDLDQLRTGLNQSLAPAPGGPGGGRGGPAGGSFLQGRDGSRNGLSAARGIDFKFAHANLEFGGSMFKDIGVRYKGNGTYMQSRGSDKRSLKLDLDHYVKGQKIGESSKLNLHNCVTDASWMNEVLAYQLYRDAGVAAPRTAYARLRVTVPGVHDNKYFGLYSLVENEDTRFLEQNYGSRKGALFKPVTPRLFDDLGDDWSKYIQIYDPKTAVSEKEARRVIEFAHLVTGADDAEFASKVGDYLDLEQFSRFMAVTAWLSTLDSILGMGQNFVVYLHPKTDKFHFMPWDLDHSFGQFGMVGSQEEREALSIQQPWQGNVRFLERVYKVDAFQKLYRARLDEFSKSISNPNVSYNKWIAWQRCYDLPSQKNHPKNLLVLTKLSRARLSSQLPSADPADPVDPAANAAIRHRMGRAMSSHPPVVGPFRASEVRPGLADLGVPVASVECLNPRIPSRHLLRDAIRRSATNSTGARRERRWRA
ncbi:MAG: hypothetical protein EXS36_13160 [Pedosphaera sp.]|nr:hypothetical protein [Pedosphaera sp.]